MKDNIMFDLDEVNRELKKMSNAESQRKWYKNNKEKKKEFNKAWNDANGKEYQRKRYLEKKEQSKKDV